jgi:tRNA(fMet)-specific endonuclease VapC
MKYLLDTNTCIYLIRQSSPAVRRRLEAHPIEEVAVSAITLGELQHGVARSRTPDANQAALDQFLLPLTVLPFDYRAAAIFGPVRVALERQGQTIGPYDLLIAACALSAGLTVVTNNIREFARVPGLLVEDWTAQG